MPNPSNSDLVGEARRLSKAATPGPWQVKHEVVSADTTPHRVIAFQLGRFRDARREVASCDGSIAGQDDAKFIARARTLLPELAQQLEQAHQLARESYAELPAMTVLKLRAWAGLNPDTSMLDAARAVLTPDEGADPGGR